jgi:hypothetical protein
MDGTGYLLADETKQGDTAGPRIVGAEHEGAVRGEPAGQGNRYSNVVLAGLRPVKRHAEEGATGPTGEAGILT